MDKILRHKTRYLILLVTAAVICALASLFTLSFKVSAKEEDNVFMPASDMEYFDFTASAPKCAVYFNDKIAFITENQALWIYTENGYTKYENLVHGNPIEIKHIYGDMLVVNDNNALYYIDTTNLSANPTAITYGGTQILCDCFDVAQDCLVTKSGNTITKFTRLADRITGKSDAESTISAKTFSPICTTDDGAIFYIRQSDNKLYSSASAIEVFSPGDYEIKTIAKNKNSVYFTMSDNGIYSIDLITYKCTKLATVGEEQYDLGNVISPAYVSFKGDNLLISDIGVRAITEFKAIDSNLYFTGFAVSKNKTAYNRILSSARDIEQCGNTLAVLDGFKLTLINLENYDEYSHASFSNFFVGEAPDMFALGNGTVLSNKNNSLVLLNTESGEIKEIANCVARDICYQSGFYYLIAQNQVYKIDEKIGELEPLEELKDVYTNIVMTTKGVLLTFNGYDKVVSDFAGNVYALLNGVVYRYDMKGKSFIPEKTLKSNAKSFSMSFDRKAVYYLSKSNEYIYYTEELSNSAISSTEIPAEFKITRASAYIDELKVCTVKNGANLFSVSVEDGSFKFNGLIGKEEEYCYICKIRVAENFSVNALAGANGVILVYDEDLYNQETTFEKSPEKVYVTTSVSLYYFPIVTYKGEYRLSSAEGEVIKLSKSTALTTNRKALFTFCGREYYFVTVMLNAVTYTGYVPVVFTTTTLKEEDLPEFTVRTVSETVLYNDVEMAMKICDVEENATVKVLETNGDISLIAYKGATGWITGYITTSAIKDDPNIAVRNILILLAIAASICGTAAYFLLRKKK